MGSVGANYKCRLCGRVGNGGYALDGCDIGPICTGDGLGEYNCLDKVLDGTAPEDIIGSALEQILGEELNTKYPDLAMLVVPWLVESSVFEEAKSTLM